MEYSFKRKILEVDTHNTRNLPLTVPQFKEKCVYSEFIVFGIMKSSHSKETHSSSNIYEIQLIILKRSLIKCISFLFRCVSSWASFLILSMDLRYYILKQELISRRKYTSVHAEYFICPEVPGLVWCHSSSASPKHVSIW